ncbi:helix-turn-helix domain-containing protein [Streptomyces stackebrandtii]|uniref:helix-turn-helix domain-containing protein n=1 Tax=Streptomyces stackebrandtii TaxID=3051177 RepID=UPI0028DBDFE6|nr:helix-turn-helix transcriptional regulator [Streptomyces sp. DSM 40976]
MPKDAAVEEFSARLRALKARGGRSYEALGRRLNVSASTLHRYCSGATVPERFTVIDRMARLCGADEDERRALEDLWTRADRSRRPSPQEREREQERQPQPEEQERERAPEQEPEPAPAREQGTDPVPEPQRERRPGPEPAAVPEPAPEPVPVPRPAPELTALGTLTTAPAPRAARSRSRSWRGVLVAGAGAAVVALALVLVLVRPGLPTGPEATAPPTSTTPPSTPAESAPPPFTWTADSQVWQDGCGHVYLVDRGPGGFGPPPPPGDAATWAGAKRAVHGGETRVRISLQGRSPSSAVVLQALHVRVVGRAQPLPWTAYRMGGGCGGAVTPRHFAVDLDRPRPLARPVDGYDASGAEGRTIPAVSFPYAVTSADPEELLVTARTAGCDCRWYLELAWSSEGRSGTVRIGDGEGKPFRTSGIKGSPVHEYDPVGRRWITGADSGQSG